MSDPFAEHPLPRGLLLGAAALALGSILVVSAARYSDVGVTHMPQATAVFKRNLRFEDRDTGAVAIFDVDTKQQIELLQPGTNGFLRGVMRGLARERRAEGVSAIPPFTLTRWNDGRMSLTDPSTGAVVNLEVFGPTNSAAFAQLLEIKP